MTNVLAWWGSTLVSLFQFTLPYGVSFGTLIVAVATAPMLVKAIKSLVG